jgi:hypothetical protein
MENLKLKFYMARNFLEETLVPCILIYFVTFHEGYIEITFFSNFFYFNEIVGQKSNFPIWLSKFDYKSFFWS